MSRKSAGCLAALLIVIGIIAVPVSSAAPRHRAVRRPNLQVSRGTLTVRGARVSGSFTILNSGRTAAGRSTASLSIVVARHRRSLGSFRVAALKPRARIKIAVSVHTPTAVPTGRYRVLACADSAHRIKESSERDNCTHVGTLAFASASSSPGTGTTTTGAPTPTQTSTTPGTTTTPSPTVTTGTTTTPGATPTEPQPGPTQTPTAPMTIPPDTPTLVQDAYAGMTGSYYVDVPPSYSSGTPMRLLVWMHGCGGEAEGDTYEITASNTPDAQGDAQTDDSRDFVAISIGGADDACWDPDTDVEKVLMAVADVTTHFNIDRRHIFIGGYSSGGDLAYRTIFYNADEFAGILTVNTNPFRDTGSTEAQLLAAAAWKFNIAHVAHSGDEEYHVNACTDCLDGGDDPGVTPAMNDLSNAGYTVKYFVEPGDHYDDDDFTAGTGTDYDWRKYVRPFIDEPGWQSPG